MPIMNRTSNSPNDRKVPRQERLEAHRSCVLAIAAAILSLVIAISCAQHNRLLHAVETDLPTTNAIGESPVPIALTPGRADEVAPAILPERDSTDAEAARITVTIRSTADGTDQKALFYVPPRDPSGGVNHAMPLIVALHTWRGGYKGGVPYVESAKAWKWVMIAPDFRGANNRPEACGSELAIQDIRDAVAFAADNAQIDPERIYLVGASGGGHMALMMASKAPELWAGVSAWVPISDLSAWHAQTTNHRSGYDKMLERCCGGAPGSSSADAAYRARSPLFHLSCATGIPLDINTGIRDGHIGSVPVSQSLHAFNALAEASGLRNQQISAEQINFMVEQAAIPPELQWEVQVDPERQKPVLFRRVAGNARITVFDGGHEYDIGAAMAWLSAQRKHQAADFKLPEEARIPQQKDTRKEEAPQ